MSNGADKPKGTEKINGMTKVIVADLKRSDEFLKVVDIRRQLAGQPIGDAIETLLTNLKATKTNAELLLRGLR